MNDTPSGSFVELNPLEIIQIVDGHLNLIETKRGRDKEKWYAEKRAEKKTVGFLWWMKERHLTEEEIEIEWTSGYVGGWEFDGAKWSIWSGWNGRIYHLESIRRFCVVANDRGTKVNLSREDVDYIFMPYWNDLREKVNNES